MGSNERYIEFDDAFDEKHKQEISRKIYYISEDITNFHLNVVEGKVAGVTLSFEAGANEEQIVEYLKHVVQRDILGLRNIKTTRIWDNDDASAGRSYDVLEELIRKDYIHIHGEGQVSIKGPYIDLYDFFDRLFEGISVGKFSAERYIFPTLLKTSILKKVGYFDSFPNLLMFVVRLENTVDNFDDFRKEFENSQEIRNAPKKLLSYVRDTNYSLPPTMCYYVYDMFSNKEFIDNISVTTKGKSFRFENKYHEPLKRLWDFTIRETVFLGDSDYVRNCVRRYMVMATKAMERLALSGFCETANDPFFLVQDTTERINTQKMIGSKYELHIRLNMNETIAIGSFNLHGRFLSERFNLYKSKEDNENIHTGCVGIGLERMFFAFLSQYGIDFENWPDVVKKCINRNEEISSFINSEL